MELKELKQMISATDPAAVLVPPRVLRRLLQAEYKLPYLLAPMPHERCHFFDRQVLFSHVEQDELDLEPDRLLPSTVILLARPSAEQLQEAGRDATLLDYWLLLFHAQVHLALRQRHLQGQLTPSDVQARIDQIGQTEFEEIRTVLRQEGDLLPPVDDLNVYIEFAAVYLELRYFRANLRATYFPAIRDYEAIDRLLAQDIDADAVFARTRLAGAPDPVIRADTSSDESHDYYRKLMRHAERAGRDGDTVRAAILRTRAARVAPGALTRRTRVEALKDLESLTQHLQEAVRFGPDEAQQWLQVLPALLDKADQGNWPVEAKLLYDLQKVCVEQHRKLFAIDLVQWALAAGKRPIKRPLASLQLVRATKHLRSAAQRLTMARVSDEDRQHLARLLQAALHRSEERLRDRFRPILNDAFQDVGLGAASPPGQVALDKMIEELLDRVTQYGFVSFSELRDTISRNQLKLPDFSDPDSFWRGDPLLRLDRRLASSMEGVYRPGEFYLRWLEGFSSLFFGAAAGRFLIRNLVLPFGGALALLKGLQLCFKDYAGWEVSLPRVTFVLLGAFLLCLMHVEWLRGVFIDAAARVYRALRLVFYELPARLWRQAWVQKLLHSWSFLLIYWYGVRPLVVCAVIWLCLPTSVGSWPRNLMVFLSVDLVLNSRFGYAVGETFTEALELLYGWLRFDVVQGLFRWVVRFFKQVTGTVEYVLYTVDEWLRFRSDESRLTMVLRAILGVLWFPIGYLIRLYFVTLIEPSVNPIKLPISSLAAKFLLLSPLYHGLLLPGSHEQRELINHRLAPHTGWVSAVMLTTTVIVPTLWLLPSAVAFFFWEMQENWRLFRANRPVRLRPVVVGQHGETMLQLLKPGFHSGTIPKLFAHLRRAERRAYHTGNWRSARTYRQALQEVSRSVQVFVEREFIALLHQSRSWPNAPVRVGQIVLSCNCIRIELAHADFPQEPLWLAFEERSGWLIGSLLEAGWLKHLAEEPLQVMTSALAGLYKIAGVDVVREQIAAALTPDIPGYEIVDHQLLIKTDPRNGHGIAYDLKDRRDELKPHDRAGEEAPGVPLLDARRLLFARVPVTWERWVECWRQDHEGLGHPRLLSDGVNLLESGPESDS